VWRDLACGTGKPVARPGGQRHSCQVLHQATGLAAAGVAEAHSQGRLRGRTAAVPTGQPWAPGLRPLVGGALLLVPDRPAPGELLVYFHGAQGRAADGLALLKSVAVKTGALVLLVSSRRSTWDLALGQLGPDVAALDAVLEQVTARYDVRRLALAGFSDGASYALTLGLANGDLVEQVLAFSPGYVRALPAVGSPRLWVSHGTGDQVLPVELCGRRLAAALREQGYPVQYLEFDGGHVVTAALVADAVHTWLAGDGQAESACPTREP